MARTAIPLNDKQIKNAKPKLVEGRLKEYNLSDGQGLALRVLVNGTKQWLFNYEKPYVKTRTNISLGTYPDVTLEQARQKRLDARSLLAQNIDQKSTATKPRALSKKLMRKPWRMWLPVGLRLRSAKLSHKRRMIFGARLRFMYSQALAIYLSTSSRHPK